MTEFNTYHATLDASLRAWELVHTRDIERDGEVIEQGRGCWVSARWARTHGFNFGEEADVRAVIEMHAGEWVNLLPFQDYVGLPRVGYDEWVLSR